MVRPFDAMKTFASILAFLVFFVPATGLGVLFAIGLWEKSAKYSNSHPVAAVIVGVVCACIGILAGRHSARATCRRYDQRDDSHDVA